MTGRQLNDAVTLRPLEMTGSNLDGTNSLVSPTRLSGNRASNSCPNTQSTSSATDAFTTNGPRLITPPSPQ